MLLKRLQQFLDSNLIKYQIITHSVAYTAQGVAALTHISGKELAKTVVVKIDDLLAMAVVPASTTVDLKRLRMVAKAKSARLSTEDEFRNFFPDCETGAMPPFGNLYGMAVYADERLAQDKEIAFNAGTHRELIRMSWADYVQIAGPVVCQFAARGLAQTAA